MARVIKEARQAAELDWQAIGGTWGIATSRLVKWKPDNQDILHEGFMKIIEDISKTSPLLANYVHKYFLDISLHLDSLYKVLEPNAKIFYIVGNSKFYDTLVPVENIYAHLLEHVGFIDIQVEALRKRNSKKELVEFVVSAHKPPRKQKSANAFLNTQDAHPVREASKQSSFPQPFAS